MAISGHQEPSTAVRAHQGRYQSESFRLVASGKEVKYLVETSSATRRRETSAFVMGSSAPLPSACLDEEARPRERVRRPEGEGEGEEGRAEGG